jgi:Uma2 family endonuclease
MVTMSVVHSEKKLTEAEFLHLERKAEWKSEFFEGEVFAMSGGTRWHSLIGTNLAREFGNRLQGKPCVAYNSDLRVKVEATGLLTYPDLSIVCGEARFLDDQMDTLLNPTVIAEVLSDSTEAYDRGKKFEQYRHVPSLREYLVLSQKEPRIEQFLRQQDDQWLLREKWGAAAYLDLPSLGVQIALAEIYARVEFSPSPIRSRTPLSPP